MAENEDFLKDLPGDQPEEEVLKPSLRRVLMGLPVGGKTGMVIAIIATVIAMTGIIIFTAQPNMKALFSALPEEEAGRVVEELIKMKIPYEIRGGGSVVYIPAEMVYDTRLELAAKGMPKGEGVGFEVFDKSSMVGMTDFLQRMNYQRALQGELARTIEHVSAVRKARVHLVMPKRSLFLSQDKKPSASVVMELTRGLTPTQLNGIVHLISGSVEGLNPTDVTLLDDKGTLIAGGKEESLDGRATPDEGLSLQRKMEKTLEDRVQSMLDRVLGGDKAITRITATLDLSRVERNEELFNPEGQVPRSEQFSNEASSGQFGVGGTPGQIPNDPNANNAGGAQGSQQTRNVERETVNYEISKTVNHTLLPIGTIKKISVAVLIDGIYEVPADAEEGAAPQYKERDQAEMERLQKIIEKAVGFDPERGDVIEVSNIPFEPIDLSVAKVNIWEDPDFILELAKWGALALLGILMVVMVLRPMVAKILEPEKPQISEGGPDVAALEQALLAEGVGGVDDQPARVIIPDRSLTMSQQLIQDNIEEAREVIRFWLTAAD